MSVPRVSVPITLDRPRTLKLTMNAWCKVEEATGISMLTGELNLASFTAMRAVLWAGLLHESPEMTIEEAGDLIDSVGVAEVLTNLAAAIQVAMPDLMVVQGGETAASEDPTKSPHGVPSGPSGATTSD